MELEPMTLVLAWARRIRDTEQLVFVSDSRLSGDGMNFDGCPKILGLPRNDCAIAFAGYTGHAFPMMLQLVLAIDSSAGVNHSHRSPKGNRHMRRILNQAANAAVKAKGTILEIVYRRYVPRMGHNQAIGVIAHRHCRLIWLILHQGVRYEERGAVVSKRSKQQRTGRMIRELRRLGYRVEPAIQYECRDFRPC